MNSHFLKWNYYGYKNHTKIDSETELITACAVTSAEVNDSQMLKALVSPGDVRLHGDCAYRSAEADAYLKSLNIENQIHVRGRRNQCITELEKKENRVKSEVRARVEHPFAYMNNSMDGLLFEFIGRKRIEAATYLLNLVYNFQRLGHLITAGKVKSWTMAMA